MNLSKRTDMTMAEPFEAMRKEDFFVESHLAKPTNFTLFNLFSFLQIGF